MFTRQDAGGVELRHHVALLLGQLARPLQVGVRVLVAQRGEQRVGAVALCLQGTISSFQLSWNYISSGQSDIFFIPFPFMWQPRSLAGHRGAGKESSSKNSLCGSPPGNEDTATMFSRAEYGSGN